MCVSTHRGFSKKKPLQSKWWPISKRARKLKTFVRQKSKRLRSFLQPADQLTASFGEASQALMNNQRIELNAPSSCHCISGYCLITRYQQKKMLQTICGKFVLNVCLNVLPTLHRRTNSVWIMSCLSSMRWALMITSWLFGTSWTLPTNKKLLPELDGDLLPEHWWRMFYRSPTWINQIRSFVWTILESRTLHDAWYRFRYSWQSQRWILQYVRQKYGQEYMAQIATFGTMAAKMVLRDVSRVFGLSQSEANRWSKAIPNALKMTLDLAYG